MSPTDFFIELWNKITSFDITVIIGLVIAVLGLLFLISEIKTKIQHGTTSENLMLAFIGLTFGLVLVFMSAWVLAIALSFFVLAIYQTYQLRESPVWRELMITSVATYFVLLVGAVGDKIFEMVTGEKEQRFLGWSYNIMIYVFLIMALIFFGKKFVLVSRLMSPQILYLTLFALAYLVLWTVGKFIPGFDNLSWNYLGLYDYNLVLSNPNYLGTVGGFISSDSLIDKSAVLNTMGGFIKSDSLLVKRTIFLSLGPWEIVILLSFLMYFLSGWLLTKLLGIKPTEDKRVLKIVEEVRVKLGIKNQVKVGFVEAPILNAMAYGPWFDQRITLISSKLDEFSDDDIRGIVAHELAHNQRIHIVWLQLIASFEMIIKKVFLLPATTLDYAVVKDLMPFGLYFLISYGIIAFLYIFVRILEGDADLQTKKAGYGRQLAQALYKLEGFYQGIAGDFGLNVQLLTGKEFTEEEKLRFSGEAAIRLYRHVYRPGRWDMFANIFMSHPRTAYRIVAVVGDDLSPLKGALLPYWLLLPNFIRKKAIRNLTKRREQFSELISERYDEYYGEKGVKSFLEITRMDEILKLLEGRKIVAYDHIFDDLVEGDVLGVQVSNTICQPIFLRVKNGENENQILISDYTIHDAKIDEKYLFKDGKIGKLVSWKKAKNNNRPIFTFESLKEESNTFEKNYTGKPINYFTKLKGQEVFFYMTGADRRGKLIDIQLKDSLANSDLSFEVDDGKEIKKVEVKGEDIFIDLPPVLLRFTKEKQEVQTSLLKSIIGKSVIMFTKEELETGIACTLTNVTKEKIEYKIQEKTEKIERKKVDFLFVYDDIPRFMMKKHVSSVDRLLSRYSNRKEMRYIFG